MDQGSDFIGRQLPMLLLHFSHLRTISSVWWHQSKHCTYVPLGKLPFYFLGEIEKVVGIYIYLLK